LWKKLGTSINFSSTYHPQTDGQTEVTNKSLGNILRILVSEHPNQWYLALPQVEFSYNDSPNISTWLSPFNIIYGVNPRGVFELKYLGKMEKRSTNAEDFSSNMQMLHEKVKEQLHENSFKYKPKENMKRREVVFEEGGLVLAHLRKDRFPRGTYNKLKVKNIGPYNILRKISSNAYEIEFPEDMGISPIFNVADLYSYVEPKAEQLSNDLERDIGQQIK
jgi:hypothetical protein